MNIFKSAVCAIEGITRLALAAWWHMHMLLLGAASFVPILLLILFTAEFGEGGYTPSSISKVGLYSSGDSVDHWLAKLKWNHRGILHATLQANPHRLVVSSLSLANSRSLANNQDRMNLRIIRTKTWLELAWFLQSCNCTNPAVKSPVPLSPVIRKCFESHPKALQDHHSCWSGSVSVSLQMLQSFSVHTHWSICTIPAPMCGFYFTVWVVRELPALQGVRTKTRLPSHWSWAQVHHTAAWSHIR